MPSEIIKQVKEFWSKLGKKAKIAAVSALASVLFISILVTVLLNIKSYELLYSGLSSQEHAQIVSKLGEMAVDFKTKPGGIILVPSDKVASLKMQLSSEGYPKSTLSYDLFTSSSSFMTTDFEKRQYLIFQLQERLQEAIKTISGVRNAIVTLNVTDESNYVLETDVVPSTASLVLDLESSVSLTPKQIKGIENLIAKSVPGLTNDNVSIIDSEGNILNSGISSGSGVNLEKVEIEKQAGEIYKEKIIKLLEPIYGEKGVSVAVNVSIDFTQKTTDQIQYTPVDIGAGADSDEDTERFFNQIQSQIVNNGGEVSRVSASVIINKSISAQERAEVNEIVANSLGVERENVIVTSMEFEAANKRYENALEALKPKPSLFAQSAKYILPFASAAVALAIALVLVLIKKRKPKPAASLEYEEVKDIPSQFPLTDEVPAIVLNETREQAIKRQIKEFTSTHPQIVAQLIRTWLKEDEE